MHTQRFAVAVVVALISTAACGSSTDPPGTDGAAGGTTGVAGTTGSAGTTGTAGTTAGTTGRGGMTAGGMQFCTKQSGCSP